MYYIYRYYVCIRTMYKYEVHSTSYRGSYTVELALLLHYKVHTCTMYKVHGCTYYTYRYVYVHRTRTYR